MKIVYKIWKLPLNCASQLLKKSGATRVRACKTHALLSGKACSILQENEFELIATDSNDLEKALSVHGNPKLQNVSVVSIAHLLEVAIQKHHDGQSLSELFFMENLYSEVWQKMSKEKK